MQVQIQVKGLSESAKLRRFASNKLNVALSRFSPVIEKASMQLDDINGPDRGGVDKLCRVVLRMKNNSIVVIEELGSDIRQAIDRVSDRLHHSASRHISRQLSHLVKTDRSGLRQNAALLNGA
jgi:putative sigma-54 modulation protein